jgi:hypothetical protein
MGCLLNTDRQSRLGRVLTALVVALFIAVVPFFAFSTLVLQHFYVLGAFWGDSGTLAFLIWHNSPALLLPKIDGGGSFFAIHVSPIFVIINFFSYILPLNKIQFFALFTGLTATLPAVAIYWLLFPRNSFLSAFMGVLFAFNGIILAAARNPHYELLIIGTGMLFFVAFVKKSYRLALLFFIICLLTREDAGLDLFCILLASLFCSGNVDNNQIKYRVSYVYCAIALAYSLTVIVIQHHLFLQSSAFVRVYLGDPAFHEISPIIIFQRLAFYVVYRPYLWLPELVIVLWAWTDRNLSLAAACLAFTPWFLLHLCAQSPIAATLSNYYGFPFCFALFWPFIALYPRMDTRHVGWLLLMIACSWTGLGLQHNPGHIGYPKSFIQIPALKVQSATNKYIKEFALYRNEYGAFIVDGSVAALVPNQISTFQVIDAATYQPQTLIYFAQGYQTGLSKALIKSAHLVHHYMVPGTYIRLASKFDLPDLKAIP